MLAEVSANGPIVVHIRTNDAFFAYAGGIFMGGSGNAGDHALALIGWGTDGGTKYWLVSNSWGARPPAPHPCLLEQLERMHAHTTRPCSVRRGVAVGAGTTWGEGGFGRIVRGRDVMGIESGDGAFAVKLAAVQAQPCAGLPPCLNGGARDSSCKCVCGSDYVGDQCERCALRCAGESSSLDTASCKCKCGVGYFGKACDSFVLGFWCRIPPISPRLCSALLCAAWRLGPAKRGSARLGSAWRAVAGKQSAHGRRRASTSRSTWARSCGTARPSSLNMPASRRRRAHRDRRTDSRRRMHRSCGRSTCRMSGGQPAPNRNPTPIPCAPTHGLKFLVDEWHYASGGMAASAACGMPLRPLCRCFSRPLYVCTCTAPRPP